MNELQEALAQVLEPLRASAFLPAYILLAFVVAGALFLPVWFFILETGVLVEPPLSFVLALGGASLSASLFFGLGRLLRGPIVRRFGERKVLLAIRGAQLEHIIGLRVLPVLPFTLVNMAAGALGVPYRTFLLGTLLGMAPGVLAVTLLGETARDAFVHPTPASIALLAAAALALVLVMAGVRKLARRFVRPR